MRLIRIVKVGYLGGLVWRCPMDGLVDLDKLLDDFQELESGLRIVLN